MAIGAGASFWGLYNRAQLAKANYFAALASMPRVLAQLDCAPHRQKRVLRAGYRNANQTRPIPDT